MKIKTNEITRNGLIRIQLFM